MNLASLSFLFVVVSLCLLIRHNLMLGRRMHTLRTVITLARARVLSHLSITNRFHLSLLVVSRYV